MHPFRPTRSSVEIIGNFEAFQKSSDQLYQIETSKRAEVFQVVLGAMAAAQLPDWWTSQNEKECIQLAISMDFKIPKGRRAKGKAKDEPVQLKDPRHYYPDLSM